MTPQGVALINSEVSVAGFISSFGDLPTNPPSFYFELEGDNVSRNGSVSIMTIFLHPKNQVYFIDLFALGSAAFTTPGHDGTTLKDILESTHIPKVFFDVRNAADAMYAHYDIRLQGVQDIQLMENAARRSNKKYLRGLSKCIFLDAPLTLQEKRHWMIVHHQGHILSDPRQGGFQDIFDIRPLSQRITKYCISRVQYLPKLRRIYLHRLNNTWREKVEEQTRVRVEHSQHSAYRPYGPHTSFGPWEDDSTLLPPEMPKKAATPTENFEKLGPPPEWPKTPVTTKIIVYPVVSESPPEPPKKTVTPPEDLKEPESPPRTPERRASPPVQREWQALPLSESPKPSKPPPPPPKDTNFSKPLRRKDSMSPVALRDSAGSDTKTTSAGDAPSPERKESDIRKDDDAVNDERKLRNRKARVLSNPDPAVKERVTRLLAKSQ